MPSIPDILLRRTLAEEYVSNKRLLDDEELTIMYLLDDQGKITTTKSLTSFMLLLTRLEKKVEHRALSIEILTNHLSPDQSKNFVMFGGFRLLRRWLKEAEELDSLYELAAIIRLTSRLPFDSNAIKVSEIGKLIKRLQKYQPKNPNGYQSNEVNEFIQDVNRIVDQWKEQLAVISKNKQQLQQQQPKPKESVAIPVKKEIKDQAPVVHTAEPKDNSLRAKIRPTIQPETIVPSREEQAQPMEVESAVDNVVSDDMMVVDSEPSIESKEISEVSIPFPAAISLPATIKPVSRERKPLDMVEGARKLLAMRSQQAKAAADAKQQESAALEAAAKELAPTGKDAKPMNKGGLKKKDSKRDKLSVKWADENGGLLRDIQTIEVEKIKSSVANYKSHKDLVKRERQLEKDIHLTKTTEAMQRTTAWRQPKPLNLSLQITDNIGVPTASIERDIQSKRIVNVLEVKYLDESLIPNDPEDDLSMHEESDITPFSIIQASQRDGHDKENQHQLEIVPWTLAGQEEEEDLMPPLQPVLQDPSMMIMGMGNSMGMDPSTGFSYSYSDPTHYQAPAQASQAYHMPSHSVASHQTFPTINNFSSEYDINTFVNSRPLALRSLDPYTLQILVSDPSIVHYLVLPDGSVDESNLIILSNCTTAQDFHTAMSIQQVANTYGAPQTTTMSAAMPTTSSSTRVSRWDSTAAPTNNFNLNAFQHNFIDQQSMNSGWNDLMGGGDDFYSKSMPKQSASQMGKSATPCRFFNSPKGCSNGDKCKFGHFRDSSIKSNFAMSSSEQLRGPGQRLSGPGGNRSHGGFSSSMLSNFEGGVEKRGPGRPLKKAKY